MLGTIYVSVVNLAAGVATGMAVYTATQNSELSAWVTVAVILFLWGIYTAISEEARSHKKLLQEIHEQLRSIKEDARKKANM